MTQKSVFTFWCDSLLVRLKQHSVAYLKLDYQWIRKWQDFDPTDTLKRALGPKNIQGTTRREPKRGSINLFDELARDYKL